MVIDYGEEELEVELLNLKCIFLSLKIYGKISLNFLTIPENLNIFIKILVTPRALLPVIIKYKKSPTLVLNNIIKFYYLVQIVHCILPSQRVNKFLSRNRKIVKCKEVLKDFE